MRTMIRIISGFFMAAIGTGLCLEARYLDSMLLKVLLVLLGVCSIALGLYVLVKNPQKDREFRPDIVEDEREEEEGRERR